MLAPRLASEMQPSLEGPGSQTLAHGMSKTTENIRLSPLPLALLRPCLAAAMSFCEHDLLTLERSYVKSSRQKTVSVYTVTEKHVDIDYTVDGAFAQLPWQVA